MFSRYVGNRAAPLLGAQMPEYAELGYAEHEGVYGSAKTWKPTYHTHYPVLCSSATFKNDKWSYPQTGKGIKVPQPMDDYVRTGYQFSRKITLKGGK